jgi:hypothetical protein
MIEAISLLPLYAVMLCLFFLHRLRALVKRVLRETLGLRGGTNRRLLKILQCGAHHLCLPHSRVIKSRSMRCAGGIASLWGRNAQNVWWGA